jgi:hypothetical protein
MDERKIKRIKELKREDEEEVLPRGVQPGEDREEPGEEGGQLAHLFQGHV